MSTDADLDLDQPAIAPPDTDGGDDPRIGEGRDDGHEEAPGYRRSLNESTRKLFQAAAEKVKGQLEDDGADDLVPVGTPTEPPVAAAPSTTTTDATPAPGASSSPAAAAAPALDDRKALELDVWEKALAEREKALEQREQGGASIEAMGERYLEKSADTLRDLIKQWTGAETDEALKDEVADLITELSSSVLGLPVSAAIKERTEARRAIRAVKHYKTEQQRKEAAREKAVAEERAAAEQTQRERAAQTAIGQQLATKAADYPHLMAEDNPDAIVWDVIKTKASRDPNWQPNWAEAAELANAHFKNLHTKQHQKISRLFTPSASAPAVEAKPQGAAQSRAARTLTNASTAPVPPSPPTPSEEDDAAYDKDKARARSLAKLRQAQQQRTT